MSTVTLPTTLPLTLLKPGKYQPREHMDADTLAELALSIRAQGIMQPIIVRPINNGHYEIIAGERRSRAAKIAGLHDVPVLVKDVPDHVAAMMALVENIQREELHELDEANGYDKLSQEFGDKAGLTPAEIGKAVGKDAAHVRKRLRLARLIPQAQEAFRKQLITLGTAEEVARMPPSVQADAFPQIMGTQPAPDKPVKHRDATQILQQYFMLRLNTATFPIKDETLVPEAGGCHNCPKRTGANPDLFADVQEADTCTDRACHATKVKAHNTRRKDEAREQGLQVIEGDAARVLLKFGESSTQLGGEYVYMDEPMLDITGSTQSLTKLLGTLLPPSALFEHPKDLTLREIVHVVKATDELRKQGLLKNQPVDTPASRKPPKPTDTTVATAPDRSEREPSAPKNSKQAAEDLVQATAFHKQWREDTFRAYHKGLHDIGYGMATGMRRAVAMELALGVLDDADAMALMADLWGWQVPAWPTSLHATLEPIFAEMLDDELDLLIAELMVLPDATQLPHDLTAWTPGATLLERAAADDELQVDVTSIIAHAKQAVYGKPKAPKKGANKQSPTYPTESLPPAGEHNRARAEKKAKPNGQAQEDTSQQAQGPEGDDQTEASTTSVDATPADTAGANAHWVGQVVKIKGTKKVRKIVGIATDGAMSVEPIGAVVKGLSTTTHTSSELLVLPDQVRPTATTKSKKGGK